MFKRLLGNHWRTKQPAAWRHAVCMTVVAVMCVGVLTPGYSRGSTERASASSRILSGKRAWGFSRSVEHCHFSLDDKMSMAEGTFGRSVHDPGPGYRCWEREKAEQR
jgi:hypothetical protein